MTARAAIARAAVFVASHGDPLAAARARALAGDAPARDVLVLLPSFAADPDRARAERILRICGDLRLLGAPGLRELCGWLADSQSDDGAWRAPGASDAEARCTTGMLAGQLAKTPFARPALLEAAGDFLAADWTPDRVSNGRWRELAAHAVFFANADHARGDEILQWCGRELERGFRTRVLVDCDAHSLPGARFESGELLVALVTEQAADGSFGVGESPDTRVEPTLDGLCALTRFSRVP